MTSICPSSISHDNGLCAKDEQKPKSYSDSDDDDNANDDDADFEPFWSDGWLRENTDFTVMAIFKRKKGKDDTKPVFGQPDAESDPELAKNTMMNRQRPTTPGQGGSPFQKPSDMMAPALPQFAFEGKPGSRPTSRNGVPEPPPKGGIMKHPNTSSGALAPPAAGGRSVSSPLAGGTGPALKMGDRSSHARIVSMMAPGDDDDDEDPPSPVSPVDDDEQQKFPPNGKDALGRSVNLRSASSTTKLPPLITQTGNNSLAPTISMGTPMLRPNSHIGIGGGVDSPSRPRVSFQPPEPKGKEKAVGGVSTPTGSGPKHLRFDSSTFNDKGKEAKKAEEKPSSAKKFAPSLIIPRFGGGRGRGTPTTETPTEKLGAETPTDRLGPLGRGRGRGASGASTPRSSLAPPPSAMKSRPNGPETGQLTPRGRGAGLQRADSQFDRMAAIANAHRMMREQFDEVHGVAETPADLMASESAARMASQPRENDKLGVPPANGKAIAPIAEEETAEGRTGRSRASSMASVQSDNRSRSRESRPNGAYGHGTSDSRSSSMPRYTPGSGARASSIPRPESIVGGDRRQSWGSGPIPPDNSIGIAITTSVPPVLTISKGQSPVTTVSTSSLGGLPSQQRRSSAQGEPRLSAGPGPTIRSELPASQSGRATPTMVITSPESPPRKVSQQVSTGRQSQQSVSSMGDGPDSSTRVSTADSKHSASSGRPSLGRSLERPMSYVMSDRDERGYISEVISTGKLRTDGSTSEAEDDAASGASPAVDKKTLARLMGDSSDRSGQTSRTSLRSDDDDDLYKQPSPKVAPVSSNELEKESSAERPTSNTSKHRSVQLYDRPFSRDESTSGTSTPSQKFVTPLAEPDANPIAHMKSPPTPAGGKKGGLLGKLMGKPGPGGAAAASAHSQNSSRDTTKTSSEEQRLSSMTSTTASVQSDVKEKKGRRGSGFFSLKRPSSTEPLTMKDDSVVPPHNQVRINTNVPPAASPVSAGATPRRSATSVEPTKKRRGTFGGLFSRGGSSTPTSQQAPPMPQKPSARSTIFHRVPNATSPSTFQGPRETQGGSTTPGGRYASNQGSRPASSQGRPPSFVHTPGASGHAAIAAQQGITTHISSDARRERRSMSLTGSGGLFGRKRADSTESTRGRDRSNSIESQGQTTRLKKWRKGSKGSITGGEGIQHQERPWAITLPGAEDNDPQAKEIERAEIMHAASNRWQRGADGQMYPMTEPSPNSATPISPRGQQGPPHPGNQGFTYMPSNAPAQQRPGSQNREQQSPDFYSPQTQLPPPASYPARPVPYRAGHSLDRDPEKPAVYEPANVVQPVIPPLPQANVPLMQPQPRRTSWQADVNDPRMDPSYRSQGNAASRATTTTATTSTSARAAQNPNVSSPRSPRGQGRPEHFQRPPTGGSDHRSPQTSRDGPPQHERRPSVPMKDRPQNAQRGPSRGTEKGQGAVESQNFVAALEAERRKHGEHTGMGASSSKARRPGQGLHVNVPVTSGAPPPQVGVFSDTTAAVASTGLGARRSRRDKGEDSGDEDSAPVMKATSFPGDEWVPEFYYE